MSKKITIELDDKYSDIITFTCMGVDIGIKARLSVTNLAIEIEDGMRLTVDPKGNLVSYKRDPILYPGCEHCEHKNSCIDAFMEHSQHCNNYVTGGVDCGWCMAE